MAPWQLYQPSLNCFSKEPLQSLGLLALVKLYTRFLRTLSSVQFNHSVVSDSATPWTTAHLASLTITNSRNPPKPMSIESVMPSNYLIILCSPFSSCPQSFPTSGSFQVSQLLTSGGQSIRVSASKSVLPNEHPGLISFSMDWLDLLEHHRRSLGIKTQRLGSPDVNISC